MYPVYSLNKSFSESSILSEMIFAILLSTPLVLKSIVSPLAVAHLANSFGKPHALNASIAALMPAAL